MGEENDRLKHARKRAGFETATDAARRYAWNLNTYRSHENGERGLKKEAAARYARAFRVSASWLYGGEEGEGTKVLPMIGLIAAGNSIQMTGDDPPTAESLFEIEVPFPVPFDAVALEVRGESMYPRYDDGDVIICYRHSQDPSPFLGTEVAVGTPDGDRYLKKLRLGSAAGLFTLESHNAPPIRDVQVAWASEIFGLVRATRWRRLDMAGRARAMKRAIA